MKKLLSITPHLSTGGAPQVLVNRIGLINGYFDIYVVEYSNISSSFVVQKNRIKKLLPEDKFFTLGKNKYELINIINDISPDIIHMEEIPEMFMDYKISKEIYKKDRNYKIFETTHSSDFNVNNKVFLPDKFLFVSQYNCFKFNKFGIPTEVIEYPIDRKKRNLTIKNQLMGELNLDPSYKHILNVGLFTPRKNQAYAFDIARHLKDEKIKFHFVGNQAENFKRYWEPLMQNKPHNCVIWGERDDVDKFYNACDLFLFTSMGFRYDKELNPLVIKEAIQEDIPLFLFPLDVYCGKYDNEELCTYMTGDAKKDSDMIKDFFKSENQKSKIDNKDTIFNKYLDNYEELSTYLTGDAKKDSDMIKKVFNSESKIESGTIKNIFNNEFTNVNKNLKIDYNKDSNKIFIKYLDDCEENFDVEFKNDSKVLYSTNLTISNKYNIWVGFDKIDELDYVIIEFSKYNKYLFNKVMYLKEDIEIENDNLDSNDIYVVSSYPDKEIVNDVTYKCLKRISDKNRKIILSSHLPVSEKLQNLSTYYIYDSYNPLIKHSLYKNYWYQTDEYKAYILFNKLNNRNDNNQTLTVLNNIENSVTIAQKMGYKRIIFINYDFILSDNDFKKIDNIINKLDNDNKKGYFIEFLDNDLKCYKTTFFIIDTDTFLKAFDNKRVPESFNKDCDIMNCDNFLERYVYNKLSPFKDELIIENTKEEKLFNGDINIFSCVEYLTILPVVDSEDRFVLWLNTSNKIDDRRVIFSFYNNGIEYDKKEYVIDGKFQFYEDIKINDTDEIEIEIDIIDNKNNEIIKSEYFGKINKSNMKDLLKDRGYFEYKIDKQSPKEYDKNITTIINFNIYDFNKLEKVVESVKSFSKNIIVCYNDKYENILNKFKEEDDIFGKLDKSGIDFIEYEYDYDIINNDINYWDNVSRIIGIKYTEEKNTDWILFINSDEIITDDFDSWFNNKPDGDSFLFEEDDSPLLIKRNIIEINGNRLDIIKKSDKQYNIAIENKGKIKLYNKI